MSASRPQKKTQAFRPWVVRIVWLTVALVVVAVITVSLCATRTALTADRHLLAMYNAIGACHAYVEQNDGQWPKTWNDVVPLFPDERDWDVRNSVVIDFAADPAQLAKQDWKSFTGIQPEQPVYLAYEWRLRALIELLKKHHPENGS